jgi:hypothetical protein
LTRENKDRAKARFTLRFSDEATPEALRVVAKARRKSMNALIEEMVERELPLEINAIEAELTETLAALRRFRGNPERAWAEFAAAEGQVEDPIKAERVVSEPDPYGVNAAFA